jgi:uncharacterized membrane protein YfcA
MEFFEHYHFLVPCLFFLVALTYSSVGLGGGSSYTALMAILGMSAAAIPMISLSLNVLVTTVGSYHYLKHDHGRLKVIMPFLISSIPMAYLGGAIRLPKHYFYLILLISLIFVAVRIYFWQDTTLKLNMARSGKIILSLICGAILGLIAGIVGIGGGIYLVPLIIILGIGTPKEAAACGSVFIWLNSIAGLAARLQFNTIDVAEYIPLIFAVLAGGFAGSFLGAAKLSPRFMEKILGSVVIVAIIFLVKKIMFLI